MKTTISKTRKTINEGRAALIGKARKSPAFVRSYEDAVLQEYNDNRVEAMMLFFAEVLHDELGFGQTRTRRILRRLDDYMVEFCEEGFDLDRLRIRIFEKTNFVFACNAEDQKHVEDVLEAAGYKVNTDESAVEKGDKHGQ